MLLLGKKILVELSQTLSVDLADLAAGRGIFTFHFLILIEVLLTHWLAEVNVAHSPSMLRSPVAWRRPLIIVSISALLCNHDILIFGLLSLNQIHLKSRVALCLLTCVSGHRLHVAHRTFIEKPRYHRIETCLVGLETL